MRKRGYYVLFGASKRAANSYFAAHNYSKHSNMVLKYEKIRFEAHSNSDVWTKKGTRYKELFKRFAQIIFGRSTPILKRMAIVIYPAYFIFPSISVRCIQ